jgi:formate dehydrogenase subunit gamma
VGRSPESVVSPEVSGNQPPQGRSLVPRFGPTERFAHWWTVALMATALLTGLALDDSDGGIMSWLHVGSVVLIGLGLLVAALAGDHRALLRATRALFLIDRRDVAWLRDQARLPGDRRPEPQWGMFNAGQKLFAWALGISATAMILTGIGAWFALREGGDLHEASVLATGALLGLHLFMALVNPATRPSFRGMVFGRVNRGWAAAHHGDWLREVDQRPENA